MSESRFVRARVHAHYEHVCSRCASPTIQRRPRSRKTAQRRTSHPPTLTKTWQSGSGVTSTPKTAPWRRRVHTNTHTHIQMLEQSVYVQHSARTHRARGRGLCLIAGTLPAYMSLIRLRSREQARIKPRLIRNRMYRFHITARRNDTAFQPSCAAFRCLFCATRRATE